MTNESATSTAIPPQHPEHHQPPPNPINSATSPPPATVSTHYSLSLSLSYTICIADERRREQQRRSVR